MRRQEAKSFYEEDEDPQKIFALFEAGQKHHTSRPARHGQELRPIGPILEDLVCDLPPLRLWDRLTVALRHLSTAIELRNRTY